MRHSARPVIVIGDEAEIHVRLVTERIRRTYHVINVGQVERGIGYEFDQHSSQPKLFYAGKEIDIRPGSIASIWNRRGSLLQLRRDFGPISEEYGAYAISSMTQLAEALQHVLPNDALWVSRREAILRAEGKPLQISVARAIGFDVPDTLFTSDAKLAERFVGLHKKVIIKTLAKDMPSGGKTQYATLHSGGKIDFRGLHLTPQIFQQAINPKEEVRVAVIGNNVHASLVADQDEASAAQLNIRDFRHALNKKDAFVTQPIRLPENLAAMCVEYVRQMGLVCGFFDLIRDTEKRWWFIECNPNGNWAFVDDETSAAISTSLANMLNTGHPPWLPVKL